MATYYIIGVTKSGNSSESEIIEYLYNTDKHPNTGTRISKEDFWKKVQYTYRSDYFYCFNATNNPPTLRQCFWEFDAEEPYLKTEPNGTARDNLLSLPGIKGL